jgi:hypothetical protein
MADSRCGRASPDTVRAIEPLTRLNCHGGSCHIVVTLAIANHAASLLIAYQLYLPEDWDGDEVRRKDARVRTT